MILDKNVEVKLNSRNLKRLLDLGYFGKIGDKINVLIEHLSRGSKCIINVKCDICDNQKEVSYLNYNNQTDFDKNKYYCSKCREIKKKELYLIKFGVDNPMKLDSVKNKIKNNNIKKYGVVNVFQIDEVKKKIKETCLEKYGVENPNKSFYIREKTKKTCLEKYGVENPLQNEDILKKSKETCLEKYGVDSYMRTKEFRKKSKDYLLLNKVELIKKRSNTNVKKYGFVNVFQLEHIKEKIKKTCIEKYGVEHPSQNENIFLKGQNIRFKIEKYKDSNIYSQGSYEKDFLENFYDIVDIKRSKSFIYFYNDNKHYYHPDYYLPKFNLIVEIKSKYTYELELYQNMAKRQACLDEGYDYIFIIDKNYTEINKLINDN